MTEQQIDLQERELDYWMTRAYEAEGKLWKAEARIAEGKRLRMKATAAATKAEARIKAVGDVLTTVEDGHSTDPVIRGMFPRMVNTDLIRRALESVPPPSA